MFIRPLSLLLSASLILLPVQRSFGNLSTPRETATVMQQQAAVQWLTHFPAIYSAELKAKHFQLPSLRLTALSIFHGAALTFVFAAVNTIGLHITVGAQTPTPTPPTPPTPAEQIQTLNPSDVKVVYLNQTGYLSVNGQLWAGAMGYSVNFVPDGQTPDEYKNGRLALLYKALLPPGGKGIDPKIYPDLIELANSPEGAKASDFARILAVEGKGQYMRTANLTATTLEDMKRVARIILWARETYGLMFIPGMYDPDEGEIDRVLEAFKDHPALLFYEALNEFTSRKKRQITPEEFKHYDDLLGKLKAKDPYMPIAVVVSQNLSDQDIVALQAMKNVDIINVTIYGKDGQGAEDVIRRLQRLLAPKMVGIAEYGISFRGISEDQRARQFTDMGRHLIMRTDRKISPVSIVTIFQFLRQQWKGELDDKAVLGTPSFEALAKISGEWKPGPRTSTLRLEEKPIPTVIREVLPASDLQMRLTQVSRDGTHYGRWKAIDNSLSDRLLSGKVMRYVIEPSKGKLEHFEVDIQKEGKDSVYTVSVDKAGSGWKVSKRSVMVQPLDDGRLLITIPSDEVKQSLTKAKASSIARIFVKTHDAVEYSVAVDPYTPPEKQGRLSTPSRFFLMWGSDGRIHSAHVLRQAA